MEWHINADEPRLLDYNLENGRDPNLFDGATPYRASDHDPVVVGIDLTN
jgi:predicted extracellular nuclease